MLARTLTALPCFAVLAAAAAAQAPFQGNGLGSAYLRHTAAVIGGTMDAQFGSPAGPGAFAVFGFSDGLTPTVHPLTGLVGLDLTSPFVQLFFFALDGAGNAVLSAPVPNVPSLALAGPLFGGVAVFEPSVVSVTRTSRFALENRDSYSPAGALAVGRGGHTATPLGSGPADKETRVLVVGGGRGTILVPQASVSTEIYEPLTRTAVPGPNLTQPRAWHQAVRLGDGTVLVCGGVDSAGVVTATTERFDLATNQFVARAPMLQPRAGHAATLLPSGKVLVSGGLANYVNPLNNLAAVLNTAQASAELYDPIANTWTAVPGAMASPRSGHVHTVLGNGQILISGGIRGGTPTPFGFDLPVYTPTCSLYDPTTNALSATGSMAVARAFHGASVLANGDVLVTGGTVTNAAFGLVGATDSCERWNGATFSPAGLLPQPVTNHVQFAAANGDAVLVGGLTGLFPALGGTANAGRHNGTAYVPGRNVGENLGDPAAVASPRGAMTGTVLCDGTLLLLGGTDGATALADAIVYLQ